MNLVEGEWHQIEARYIRGQMFEDPYELAKGVIGAVRNRGETTGHTVHRFNFNTARTIRSPLLTI
ncbi:MAG: hypothetical protein HC800_22805 [Phormidesmis sp. RL_2_1]|nr:hypothetical protein [Phormidesmis sp. RL_2_1]